MKTTKQTAVNSTLGGGQLQISGGDNLRDV